MSWWKIILYFTVTGAVELLSCDPETQYLNQDGQCCKKCGPGTRMFATVDNCLDPICKPCSEDEYQAGHTERTKCDLQPYCDPNKNFVPDGPESTKKRVVCVCQDGYHCSSQACITCVEHSHCGPGQRVRDKGNHAHDTVCQDCPPNTFSTEEPADSDCQNWTVCEAGSQSKTAGTARSDTVCEKLHRSHIWVIVPVIIIVILALIAWWKCRGNATNAQEKVEKGFQEIGGDGGKITRPAEADPRDYQPKNGLIIRHPQEEEEQTTKLAEENDDYIVNTAVTEHGKIVTHDRSVVSPQDYQYCSSLLGTFNT